MTVIQSSSTSSSTLPKTMRVVDAAEFLGLSKKQVLRMILAREIRARKLSPKRNSPWIIPTAEVERFLDEVGQ